MLLLKNIWFGKYLRWIGLISCVVLGMISRSVAQNSSFEFWPEADIWYTLSPAWRLSVFVPVTKYNESSYRDLNIYLQADYRWGHTKRAFVGRMVDENKVGELKAWMVRGGFMEGWSIGENASDYTEDMVFGEIHRKIPLKGGFLLSQRFRTDLRWVGQDPKYSYRFRFRLMLEKEYKSGGCSIVPYVNAEPYWDSRYTTVNRVRAIGGATLSWGKRLAYEGNLTYQYDEHYESTNLYALNIILHVFFERKSKPAAKTENKK
jgi:hypothetical protein